MQVSYARETRMTNDSSEITQSQNYLLQLLQPEKKKRLMSQAMPDEHTLPTDVEFYMRDVTGYEGRVTARKTPSK